MNPLRRCAALIAAYAVALQAVLGAFAFVAPVLAGEAGTVICRSDSGTPDQPQTHDQCGACLAGHCAAAAAGPERLGIPAPWPIASMPAATLLAVAFAPPAPRSQPHSPRAPPAG